MHRYARYCSDAIIYAAIVATGLAGCARQDSTETQTAMNEAEVRGSDLAQITGTVFYKQRIALTPDAELNIQLQDISRADVRATVIAERTLTNPGQVPISFTIDYDPSLIDERFTYSVRATLNDRGRMMFTTDTVAPVLTGGNGNNVELMLVMVGNNGSASQAAALAGTRWILQSINGEPISSSADTAPAYIQFDGDEYTVEGFGGCNQFSGSWALEDETISFGALAMTMRACINGMDTEQAFMQALKAMDRHEIEGNILRFFTDDKEVLAFRAAD